MKLDEPDVSASKAPVNSSAPRALASSGQPVGSNTIVYSSTSILWFAVAGAEENELTS